MHIRNILLTFILLFCAFGLGLGAYVMAIRHSQPNFAVEHKPSRPLNGEKSLPFYEVMSPLPTGDAVSFLPKIEYKKGPPDRYIERVSLLFMKPGKRDKERIVYYGRRTPNDWVLNFGLKLLKLDKDANEAQFLANAIEYTLQGTYAYPSTSPTVEPLVKLVMLEVALPFLNGATRVEIMDQAGTPAFLIFYATAENEQKRAVAYFFRRDSQFKIEYLADHEFQILSPEELFEKSFLVAKRQDALAFVAQNLSEVHFGAGEVQSLAMQDIAWPLALLAATLSIDPSSLDAYFHFAGLNALLFKSKALDVNDAEVLDTLRSNVLSVGFYAQDVFPQSAKAAEIARLARTLTRNME